MVPVVVVKEKEQSWFSDIKRVIFQPAMILYRNEKTFLVSVKAKNSQKTRAMFR
jgi:hypothetical protein